MSRRDAPPKDVEPVFLDKDDNEAHLADYCARKAQV